MATPLDMARVHPVPPAPTAPRHLPPLVVPGSPRGATDAWEIQPTAIRVADVQASYGTAKLAVRQGDRRAAVYLTAAALRELAEHLHDCADLIDPPIGDAP